MGAYVGCVLKWDKNDRGTTEEHVFLVLVLCCPTPNGVVDYYDFINPQLRPRQLSGKPYLNAALVLMILDTKHQVLFHLYDLFPL